MDNRSDMFAREKHIRFTPGNVFYRPQDGEGTVLTGVRLSTPGGGVPQLQVLSQISGPRSFLGGTPVLAGGGGTPARVPNDRGTPLAWTGLGDWGTPPPQSGQDWGAPARPPPPPAARTGLGSPRRQNSTASTCYAAGGDASCVQAGGLSCFLSMSQVAISNLYLKRTGSQINNDKYSFNGLSLGLGRKPVCISLANLLEILASKAHIHAMLTSIQSACVTPEVNLGITQVRKHTRDPPWPLKPRADVTRSSNQGYQRPYEKDLCPQKKPTSIGFL